MNNLPSAELLESTHEFPGPYRMKAIGSSDDNFEGRVVEAVVAELTGPSALDYSVRSTPGGRHVALTLDMTVQSADQVRRIYLRVHQVQGLTLLL